MPAGGGPLVSQVLEVPVIQAVLPADLEVQAPPQPKGRVDGRGQHWKAKVAEGNFPVMHAGLTAWAEKRKTKQEDFKNFCKEEKNWYILPWEIKQWESATCMQKGNIQKVMFMDLVMFEFKKVVTLTHESIDHGLYGIVSSSVHVPPSSLAEFNAGSVPS
jgi:hypothetical protein